MLAAQNTSEQHSKDSSSSASIGIGISLGQENRLGFTASASVSKGNADGKDTNYSATQITGGSSVTLQSGGDTTLGGAVVTRMRAPRRSTGWRPVPASRRRRPDR
ncbi:hypothetical protein FHT39_001938 [Mitsuaria sp. BK045]|uniref:hemagglutinin repeat-containing protein n=1 Tax=unclassified Roseateles TaxID=2626991 RepID=UPI00160FF3C8|nr:MULTISPECIES: hemagglutinin repeat-containing protein [unclassified Roseateles]MBB3293299.1 hypothetical protein [Mitsuaria sp. BK041]MBB3362516.1 hypothetical protein [Mitsuaria sp. BK045]